MILVDTSVWIDHLRTGNRKLQSLLEAAEVQVHPFVVGELACGALRHREEVLALLQALPEAQAAEHEEVMRVVERERLYGRGIGWIDANLLAPARLSVPPSGPSADGSRRSRSPWISRLRRRPNRSSTDIS